MEGDLSTHEFCRTCVERTVKEFGRLDVLVHNAAHQNHWQRRYVFLASDADSRYITGEVINVLGGTTTAG